MDNYHISKALLYDKLLNESNKRIALKYADTPISYYDVCSASNEAIDLLKARNIQLNDTVILLLPDNPDFVVVFFSIISIGAIPVPVNIHIQDTDLRHIIVKSGACCIITNESCKSKVESAVSETRELPIIFFNEYFLARFPLLPQKKPIELFNEIATKVQYNRYCYILFSSGTTGFPKGIPRQHRDVLTCFESYGSGILSMDCSDISICVPKLSFGYGLGSLLFSFLAGGIFILNPEKVTADSFIALVKKSAPTILLMQPRMIIEILSRDPDPSLFKSVRVAVTAGESLSEKLYRKWTETYGVELLDGFGSTEIGHIFISNKIGQVKPGTPGKPLHGYEVKILDFNLKTLGKGNIGRLWIRGNSICENYWNDTEKSKLSFIDGGFLSDDLFYEDDEGFLYPTGRADDMIKTGCGEWIIPNRIESLLNAHHSISESIVVHRFDKNGLTIPRAYIILKAGCKPNKDLTNELRALIANTWPDLNHYHINEILYVSDLPRNVNGKIDRKVLRHSPHASNFIYDC